MPAKTPARVTSRWWTTYGPSLLSPRSNVPQPFLCVKGVLAKSVQIGCGRGQPGRPSHVVHTRSRRGSPTKPARRAPPRRPLASGCSLGPGMADRPGHWSRGSRSLSVMRIHRVPSGLSGPGGTTDRPSGPRRVPGHLQDPKAPQRGGVAAADRDGPAGDHRAPSTGKNRAGTLGMMRSLGGDATTAPRRGRSPERQAASHRGGAASRVRIAVIRAMVRRSVHMLVPPTGGVQAPCQRSREARRLHSCVLAFAEMCPRSTPRDSRSPARKPLAGATGKA
jgi:hypothetical protein